MDREPEDAMYLEQTCGRTRRRTLPAASPPWRARGKGAKGRLAAALAGIADRRASALSDRQDFYWAAQVASRHYSTGELLRATRALATSSY